jgi:hypothetical protein
MEPMETALHVPFEQSHMLRVRNIQACTTIKEACRPCNILDHLSLFAERKLEISSFSEDLQQTLEMVVS